MTFSLGLNLFLVPVPVRSFVRYLGYTILNSVTVLTCKKEKKLHMEVV